MSNANVINWLVHTSIDVSVLIVFVLLARRPIARIFGSTPTYLLWALPALALVMPEIKITAKAMGIPAQVLSTYAQLKQSSVFEPAAANTQGINWDSFIVVAWLCIAALWLVFQILAYRASYQKALLSSKRASEELLAQAERTAQKIKLRKLPRLRICARGGSPMVLGLLRPMVILPAGFETDFAATERNMILAHEMMHIKRRDLWVGFGMLLFRALQWPNPLVHIAAHSFRNDQEAACDASVLKTTHASADAQQTYLRALVKTATTYEGA